MLTALALIGAGLPTAASAAQTDTITGSVVLAEGIRAMREIDAGSVHLGWTPLWRADLMPYGGLKASGYGKEGVRSAVEEMTEVKTVILHG